MPRKPRHDQPGAWHHLTNRGLARRTMFESDRDIRKFLSLIARAVRAGRLEVHAYCVLTTHFHLLVRSPLGELSAVMQWVMNQYVRWFNRGRRRDGPLMRGRFVSKRADSLTYRRHLVRYIDFNSVEARLAAAPALYPHGSALRYARGAGPRWLTRTWIESEIGERRPGRPCDAENYALVFGEPLPPALLRWIERRIEQPQDAADPLDELLAAAPDRVLAWMRRKAELADGTSIGALLCDAEVVAAVVREREIRDGEWPLELERGSTSMWRVLRFGLTRALCAMTIAEIAAANGLSENGAWKTLRRHEQLLEADRVYADAASELAAAALRRCHAAERVERGCPVG
jgi:REP element-mobilizing transposase RayT